VDEIGKWLRSGSPFVKIGPFAPERIRGNYALGLELVVTYGTTKLDLTQRCHGYSSFKRFEAQKCRRNICATILKSMRKRSALLRVSVDCIFSHRKTRDWLTTPRPGR
jgi:hypothetical protein